MDVCAWLGISSVFFLIFNSLCVLIDTVFETEGYKTEAKQIDLFLLSFVI